MSGIALLDPAWTPPAGVRMAFATRAGGASVGTYDSLNFGLHVGDAAAAVLENRRRLCAALALPREPLWLNQVHGTHVCRDLDAAEPSPLTPPPLTPPPTADAVVTARVGVVAAIQVADSIPVLFATSNGRAIAAAHAGWRGLAAGVLESTLHGLDAAPEHVHAWLGPAIGAAHFEVGDEVRDTFVGGDAGAAQHFAINARGRWQCDLLALARRRLAALGVVRVTGGQWCTFSDPARFFSHRRESPCGRMAALIWREP